MTLSHETQPPKPSYEDLEAHIVYLESELGLRRDALQFARLKTALSLSPKETAILQSLYRAQGARVAHIDLEDAGAEFGRMDDGLRSFNSINVYICRIRKRLPDGAIVNLRGGYGMTPIGLLHVKEAVGG